MWDRRFPSLSRVHLKKRAEEEGGKSVGSFPYQRLITMPKFLVVIGKLDKLLPCQQVLGPVGRRQHCWRTTPSIVGCYMLRPIEKSTIKTRTLSSAQRLKTHVRVSLSRVHVNQQQKNRKWRHMSVCTPCCMLLLVVACCWELLRKVLTQSNF